MSGKESFGFISSNLAIVGLFFFVSFASFYIGTEYSKRQVVETEVPFVVSVNEEIRQKWFSNIKENPYVLASKSGSKYYFPWCNEIENLKPENIITFANENLAIEAGYELGGACLSFKTENQEL